MKKSTKNLPDKDGNLTCAAHGFKEHCRFFRQNGSGPNSGWRKLCTCGEKVRDAIKEARTSNLKDGEKRIDWGGFPYSDPDSQLQYGMLWFETRFALQDGKCFGCHGEFLNLSEIVFEHDHSTGLLRALTHPLCNMFVGMCKESVEEFDRLIKLKDYIIYINKTRGIPDPAHLAVMIKLNELAQKSNSVQLL